MFTFIYIKTYALGRYALTLHVAVGLVAHVAQYGADCVVVEPPKANQVWPVKSNVKKYGL